MHVLSSDRPSPMALPLDHDMANTVEEESISIISYNIYVYTHTYHTNAHIILGSLRQMRIVPMKRLRTFPK